MTTDPIQAEDAIALAIDRFIKIIQRGYDHYHDEQHVQELIKQLRAHQSRESERQSEIAAQGWQPIDTCPKKHGVNYRLWDADDLEERVTWFGNGEWCLEGNYTHWMRLLPPPDTIKAAGGE